MEPTKATELQRVYSGDVEEIKRVKRLLEAEHDIDLSFGDVVHLFKQNFYARRPDIAQRVNPQQAQA